jgi:hypothetical protein
MFTSKTLPAKYQHFDEKELEACEMMFHQSMQIKNASIQGKGGLLIDATMKDCHIKMTDGSAVFVSALATLENCVIESSNVFIGGDFNGDLVMDGGEQEEMGGRREFGSGAKVRGREFVTDNIVQSKGVKVMMDMTTKPFSQFAQSKTVATASE